MAMASRRSERYQNIVDRATASRRLFTIQQSLPVLRQLEPPFHLVSHQLG